jgi:hypothetical protein
MLQYCITLTLAKCNLCVTSYVEHCYVSACDFFHESVLRQIATPVALAASLTNVRHRSHTDCLVN